VYLPNLELQSVWREFILENIYDESSVAILESFSLLENAERFQNAFKSLLSNRLSTFDFDADSPELTYHVYVAGLLAAVGIKFSSNRESGFGRYDMKAFLADKTIIFEFKKSEKADSASLVKKANEAIQQIEDQNYSGKPMFAVGIGFNSKLAEVLCKSLG